MSSQPIERKHATSQTPACQAAARPVAAACRLGRCAIAQWLPWHQHVIYVVVASIQFLDSMGPCHAHMIPPCGKSHCRVRRPVATVYTHMQCTDWDLGFWLLASQVLDVWFWANRVHLYQQQPASVGPKGIATQRQQLAGWA